MRRLRWTAFGLVALSYMLSFFMHGAAAISGDLPLRFRRGASLGCSPLPLYVYTVMQVPTGVLVDTLGPRRS
jgi:hypothetical protein